MFIWHSPCVLTRYILYTDYFREKHVGTAIHGKGNWTYVGLQLENFPKVPIFRITACSNLICKMYILSLKAKNYGKDYPQYYRYHAG